MAKKKVGSTGEKGVAVRAEDIKKALSVKYQALASRNPETAPKVFFEVRMGSSDFPKQFAVGGVCRRFDALSVAISWRNPLFKGYEIKVSRSDFLNDDKWPHYLSACHEFYFVCPAGLIQVAELPPQVGLVWYNPETRQLKTMRSAVTRPIELDWRLLYAIIMNQLQGDKHPFYTSRAEEYRDMVRQQQEDAETGAAASRIIAMHKHSLELEVNRLQREISRLKTHTQHEEREKQALQILAQHGVSMHYWDWEERLRGALSQGLTASAVSKLQQIKQGVNSLMKELGLTKEVNEDDHVPTV